VLAARPTRILVALAGLAATACHDPAPPPRWAEGGAPLTLAPAEWVYDDDVVRIQPGGQVMTGGSLTYVLDRAGRATDDEYDPVAVLLPAGTVAGTDDADLGRIGLQNGAPPGSATAWFSIAPDGQVTLYDSDGERHDGGRWTGCTGPALRTCTYVTQLVLLRAMQRRRYRSGPSFGVGMGVWMVR
jgi:hypothetical protein